MAKTKSTAIIVKSKKTVYGTVELSPDTDLAILGITNSLMKKDEIKVTNLPRSLEFLTFLNAIEELGFILIWDNYNELRIRWNSISEIKSHIDKSLVAKSSTTILDFIIPLLLKLKGEISIDANLRSNIDEDFFESLDIEVFSDKNKVYLSIPLDNPHEITLQYDMENLDTGFLFNKLLMRNIFPKLRVIMPDYHVINTANILLDNSEDDILVCPPSVSEFKFFCSILILLDGEIEFKGFDLKFFLSHLLRFVEWGMFYEVIDNKLRVWYEQKDIKLEYLFRDISSQDLSLLVLMQTLKSKHNVRNVVPYKHHFENVIKELNIAGCRIDYHEYKHEDDKILDILVKPSVINSAKINISDISLNINLAILLPTFCSENRGRADSINLIEYKLSNFRDNINSVNLDIEIVD